MSEPGFLNLGDLISEFGRAHDWPRVFYNNSINNAAYPLGFQLSLGSGFLSPLFNMGTTLCVIENLTDNCISGSGRTFGLFEQGSNRFLAEVTELSAAAPDLVIAPVAEIPDSVTTDVTVSLPTGTTGAEISGAEIAANPCNAQTLAVTTPDPSGYVFSRSDVGEFRWIAPNSDGVIGSIWIDQACADSLGGPSRFGDWFELVEQAPAQDSIASPCNSL